MIKLTIGLLMVISLVGCGNFWDEEKPIEVSKETPTEVGPDAPVIKREVLFENEPLVDEVSLGKLSEGDVIEIYLVGTSYTPSFSGVIERGYQSRWEKRICIRDPICRFCDRIKLMECFYQQERGTCIHRYRERLDDVKSPYLFSKESANAPVKIRIGQNAYPIGSIIKYEGAKIVARFRLSKEMLLDSNEVYLKVTPEPNRGNVSVGFLGFARCDGQGQRSFSSGGPTGSGQIPNQDRIEFKVSVVIEIKE